MKPPKTSHSLLTLLALALWAPGCATPNVNPPLARANTGYVDFHTAPDSGLCWEVARFDQQTQSFKELFSEYEPSSRAILRLAFAPGHYRFRVTFLNRLIAQPGEAEVDVQNGTVTPVGVTLAETGTSMVKTKEVTRGGTVYGRYGRRTKISSDETVKYDISAVVERPVAYQPQERMPYAR